MTEERPRREFVEPLEYELPFGKHKGRSLWNIASGDDGQDADPLYLDWGAGKFDRFAGKMVQEAVKDERVAKLIDEGLEAREAVRGTPRSQRNTRPPSERRREPEPSRESRETDDSPIPRSKPIDDDDGLPF